MTLTWTTETPVLPQVPPIEVQNFLENAPKFSVFLHDGEFYEKVSDGWRCLTELEHGGGYFGSDSWAVYKTSELDWLKSDLQKVFLVRVGE